MTVKAKVNPRKAKEIKVINYSLSMLDDMELIKTLQEDVANNIVYIVRGIVDPKLLEQIKVYLISIGKGSLPSYHFLQEGCPDFHRIHQFDDRSYVKGMMQQFMFHPWNQNMFDFFAKFKHVYQLKNLIGGLDKNAFLETTPKDGHIARLSFQYYPKGGGCIKRHADPIGEHQVCVPVILLSKKGKDFKEGGAYVINENNEQIFTDNLMEIGDVIYFNAEITHGVAPIDPQADLDWFSFEGRWMLLLSIIKTLNNETTADSIQLED